MLEMPLGRRVRCILIHNTPKEHFSSSGSSRTVKGIDDFIYMHTPPCLASLLSRLIRLYPFILSTAMILQRTLYTYGNDIWSSYLGPRMWRNIMLKYGFSDLWIMASDTKMALTNKVFHLRAHFASEHAFLLMRRATTKSNVAWMSQSHDFFSQCTGNKPTRTKENQVSLDNQFPTELGEGTKGWIAIANVV